MISGLHTFIAIDPGFAKANGTGWAVFVEGQMHAFGLATALDHDASLPVRAEQIRMQLPVSAGNLRLPRVIEHMRIYPGPQQKGDQNDLLNLAYLEGVLACGADAVHLVPARKWKGNAPKDIIQARIEKRLSPVAIAQLPKAREKRGSMLEAAGIGFWAIGQLGA